jgi:hypothetical protein
MIFKQELVCRDICGVGVWLKSQRCNNFLAALVLDDWTRIRDMRLDNLTVEWLEYRQID